MHDRFKKIVATLVAAGIVAPSALAQAPQGTKSGSQPATTAPSTRAPASTAPSAAKRPVDSRTGAADDRAPSSSATPPRSDALVPGSSNAVGGGVPAMSGVTPNRAELPSSAFTKLDAGNKGHVTLDDVRQLEGFDTAFRQADQNGDGRLNASEFNTAWGVYTGNVR
jgi:hypothetical protein